MDTQIKVQVRFTIQRNGLTYSDALYFDPDEYAALDAIGIRTLANQRFAAWKAALDAAPPAAPIDPIDAVVALDQDLTLRQAQRTQKVADLMAAKKETKAQVEAEIAAKKGA